MNYVRYLDMARHARTMDVPDDIGSVVGIPRSGMLPATMLAVRLHVPLGMIVGESFSSPPHATGGGRLQEIAREGSRVLLVDDSALTGRSMTEAKRRLVESGVAGNRIVTLAFYGYPDARPHVDYFVTEIAAPRLFEWNMWASVLTPHLMTDMDGVLCADPVVPDDDGPEYEAALREARPRFIPRKPVCAIVTNRLSRWREVTEAWLRKHGAAFSMLTMQRHRTAAERRAKSDPAGFKAAAYGLRSDAMLFVESHDAIAERIAGIAKRPALSIESNRIFAGRAA